jgi:hypothetical protein
MSESNASFNNHDQPMDDVPSIWRDPFTGMYEEDSEVDFLVGSLTEIDILDGVTDAIAEEPIAEEPRRASDAARVAAANISEPIAAQPALSSNHPPEISDLVSLIQELNQCNSALLDRVSQLEEALEKSHGSLPEIQSSEPMPQDLPQAQEQITTLYNQLEFAHQTNQRQQILLETLTDQLEASQERVAQLERETSLLQQRYTEQSQTLAQAEGNCRDLQTRLHRQQRYTLQFKAALEKCLEVPVPQYEGQESPAAQISGDFLFLPKAQRIKPWAAQSNVMPGKMPWMHLSPGALDAFQSEQSEMQAIESLNLPDFTLPELQAPHVQPQPEPMVISEEVEAQAAAEEARVEPTPTLFSDPSIADPELMAHISSVVQPLADLIAEAMMAEPFPVDALAPTIAPPTPEPVVPAAKPKAKKPVMSAPEADPLPKDVPMADAEDALWQDLARLIDVSTEDVVKASLSGDFAAFEAIDFAALENSAPVTSVEQDPWDAPPQIAPAPIAPQPVEATAPEPIVTQVPVVEPAQKPVQKPAQKPAQPRNNRQQAIQPPLNPGNPAFYSTPQTLPQSSVPAFAAAQGSPSPLVYPLRPLKKRQSLAMVELPDFKKQPSSPVPS